MRISLIIPTLNEAESIKKLYDRLCVEGERFAKEGVTLELVFVDDGSKDGTPDIIKGFKQEGRVPVILVERTVRGLATAVLEGFKNATGDVLAVIDADLSHPPEHLHALFQALEHADLVVGSRYIQGGGVEEWTPDRQFFSWAATAIARPLVGDVKDPMSGFFMLKRSVVDGVRLNPMGYKILLEILVKGNHAKATEVAYTFRNRDFGKSKMDWRVTLAYFFHLAKLYLWKLKRVLAPSLTK